MKRAVNKTIMKEVPVIDYLEVTCDCCKKKIFNKEDFLNGVFDNDIKLRYDKIKFYSCNTGHDDWGRDSVDSFEEFDYCSEECLRKGFDRFLKSNIGSYTGFFRIYTQSIWVDTTTRDFSFEENIYK